MIATIFVLRSSYGESVKAALSRMAATLVSFVACLAYLLVLPFHLWGLALMIGVTALVPALIGRPGHSMTAAITTAVVMVSASLSPHDAWQQPLLRFGDTLIGVVVGVPRPGSGSGSCVRSSAARRATPRPAGGGLRWVVACGLSGPAGSPGRWRSPPRGWRAHCVSPATRRARCRSAAWPPWTHGTRRS